MNNVTSVNFGGTPASSFTIKTDTTFYISAVVGSGTTGNITVVKSGATAISADIFTIITTANDTLSLCPGGNASLASSLSGNAYQWQINTDTGFTNLTVFGPFAGVQTPNLELNNIATIYNGAKLRCRVNGNLFSKTTVLKFISTWIGSLNTTWENAENWGCGQVPDANTNVIIYNGPVIISNTTTVKSITLKPGVTITVEAGAALLINGQ